MALVAHSEPADLRNPPRPGAVRSVSPWQLMDAPTLRPSTPHEGQGTSTSRQSVGEALQELQSKFNALSQQEKEARSVLEKELRKLRSDLGEEKAKTERVAADVRALQSENALLSEQLQQEKEARSIQEEELRKLRSDLGEEKAKTDRELHRVRQELEDRCKALEEVQRSSQQVAEQLVGKALVPEFRPDPSIPGMEFSHGNRRCKHGKGYELHSAVAKEGFTSGRQQFTVVGTWLLCIGVAVANAPRTGPEAYQQGVFLDCYGTIHTPNGHRRTYTAKRFTAGSRVTMRLDFDNGTASYEVDGVDLGVVEGLTLPEGPLHPAVVFSGHHNEVAEFVPYAAAGPASLTARA